MSFDALVSRVQQAEQAVETREQRARLQWTQFKATWRAGWTPGRIIIAGLAAGFAVGRARPLRLAGDHGLLQLLRALAPLFTGSDAAQADAPQTDDEAPPA